MNCALVALLAPSLLACATDIEAAEELLDETEPAAETSPKSSEAAIFCTLPPTPPSADRSWFLSASNANDAVAVNPPNGACDAWVVNAHNVEEIKVTVTDFTDDPYKCVGTSLTTLRYKLGSSWEFVGSVTATGVWTVNGCRLPSITWQADTTSHARVHVRTSRSYPSGQFQILSYGQRFVAQANVYVPPPGPN